MDLVKLEYNGSWEYLRVKFYARSLIQGQFAMNFTFNATISLDDIDVVQRVNI